MNAMENAALDIPTIRQDRRARNAKAFSFSLFGELAAEGTRKRHIIKDIFARGETSAWIGGPGTLKSSLLASAACAVASGRDWFGYRNKAGSLGVIIFALERADLTKRRLRAQGERDGLGDLPIAVVSEVINLMDAATAERVVETVREIEATLDAPVGLLIFDTWAKSIAAGAGDEDKARDQGRVFANLQRVKNATGVHIALVGHTGKDENRGARGSNAILGDVDLMVAISGENVRTAEVKKANDAPEGVLFSFKSENHDFGPDEDGDPQTVNIVSRETVDAATAPKSKGSGWTKGLRLVREAIIGALNEGQSISYQIPGGPAVQAVYSDDARQFHRQGYVHGGDGDRAAAERQAWSRNLKEARNRNLIGSHVIADREIVWLA